MVRTYRKELLEYVKECEDSDLWDYLQEVWKTMQDAVKRGLEQEGVLPGPLNLRRKASTYYIRASGYKQSCNRADWYLPMHWR